MSLFQLLNKLTNFYEIPYGPDDTATQLYFSVPIHSINCEGEGITCESGEPLLSFA